MQYTTRPADDPAVSHVNYECPCGCTAGLLYNRQTGSEHLGRCCCGRLLWLGDDAEAVVTAAFDAETGYDLERDAVTLPWGGTVGAVLAVPARSLSATSTPASQDHEGHGHEGHSHDEAGHDHAAVNVEMQDEGHIHLDRQRVRDLVCGMMIDPVTAAATSEYKGETYYFCAPGCKRQFDADPTKFVKPTGLLGRIFGKS